MDFSRVVTIYVNSGQAQAEYDRLARAGEKLTSKQTEFQKKLDEVNKKILTSPGNKTLIQEQERLAKRLDETKAKIDANTASMTRASQKAKGELSPSLKDLQATAAQLNRELARMSAQDAGFDEKKKQAQQANDALKQYTFSLKTLKQGFADFVNSAKGVAVGVLVGNSVQAIAQSVMSQLQGTIQAVANKSLADANIRKTTGLDKEQIADVRAFFKELDTPTQNSKLEQFATEAGKLGKESVEDIKTFVDEANQITVALGEDLGENATTQIGKVADIFDTSMLKIGSSINTVGQKSSAAEAFLSEYLFRMAGIGKTADIAVPALIGYGAVLDMNGQQIEASSTAMQQFFMNFIKNSGEFEKSVGMTAGSLKTLANEKGINTAFLEFLKNLKATTSSSDDLLRKLNDLGIDGSRGASTFLVLANNIEEVEKQQRIANDAFNEGISITEEYNIKNDNLSARIDKLKKAWAGLFTSRGATTVVESLIDVGEKAIKILSALPAFFVQNRNYIIALVTAYALYNRALLANAIQTIYNTTLFRAQYAWLVITEATTKLVAIATNAYSFAQGVLTGRITMAVAIQRIQNALSIASGNIFTIVATAVTLLASAMALYYANVSKGFQIQKLLNDVKTDAAKKTTEEKASLESLLLIAKDETIAKEQRLEAIKKINAISPEYLGNLTLENINTAKGTELIKAYIVQLDKKSTAEAIQSKMIELKKKLIEQENSTLEDNVKWYDYLAASVLNYNNGAIDVAYLASKGIIAKNKETKAIQDQIDALNKLTTAKVKSGEINVGDLQGGDIIGSGGSSSSASPKDKTTKTDTSGFEAFLKKVAELRLESEKLSLSSDAREVANARKKYVELEAEADRWRKAGLLKDQEYNRAEKEITDAWHTELDALNAKNFDARSDREYQASIQSAERLFVDMKEVARRNYATGLISKEEYENQLITIEVASVNAKIQIATDYFDTSKLSQEDLVKFNAEKYKLDTDNFLREKKRKEKSATGSDENTTVGSGLGGIVNLVKIAKSMKSALAMELDAVSSNEAAKDAVREKYNKKWINLVEQGASTVAGVLQSYGQQGIEIASNMAMIKNNIENAEFEKYKERVAGEIDIYKDQLDRKVISQEVYDARVAVLKNQEDQREKELKEKQFRRNKAIQYAQAIINGIAGAVQSYLNGGGFPYGLITMAASLAATGTQIGVIASTQPSYEDGGVVKGASHNTGGISMIDTASGQKVGEMEDNEPYMILSGKTYDSNRMLVNELLRSSTTGAGYNVMNKLFRNKTTAPNVGRIQENYMYERGGIYATKSASKTMGTTNSTDVDNKLLLYYTKKLYEEQTNSNKVLKQKENIVSIADVNKKQLDYQYQISNQL
jgi:TP901 family phage tail tape measure protein